MCGATLPRIRPRVRHTDGDRCIVKNKTPPRFDNNGTCVLCSYDGSKLYKKCNDCFNEISLVSIHIERSFLDKRGFQSNFHKGFQSNN